MATSSSQVDEEAYGSIEDLYTIPERTEPPDKDDIKQSMHIFKEIPDPELSSEHEDLLSNLRTHMLDLIDRISIEIPDKIVNNQEADEASNYLQTISKKINLISSIPDDIRDKPNSKRLNTLLTHDIDILNRATQDFVELYKEKLLKFNKAMKRVMDKNDQHETRSTTQILKGIKDIPEQFFNTPAARKQQSRQQILPWKCSDEQKEDKELENALMKDNQETHIIEYVTQHGLVPDKKNMSIEYVVAELNQRLKFLNIKLHVGDEELEEKIKHLHQNNHLSISTMTYEKEKTSVPNKLKESNNVKDPSFITPNKLDNTQFFTPKTERTQPNEDEYIKTDSKLMNQSNYFTPNNDTIQLTPTDLQRNQSILLQHQRQLQNVPDHEQEQATTMADLLRFQQEANFPSVRNKTKINNKNYGHTDTTNPTEYSRNQHRTNTPSLQRHNINQKSQQIRKLFKDELHTTFKDDLSKFSADSNEHTSTGTETGYTNTRSEISKSIVNRIRKLQVEMDNLEESTDSADRIIKRLESIDDFTFQELQDLSTKLSDYNKVAKNHRKAQIDFKKEFIDIEEAVIKYDLNLFEQMDNTSDLAAAKSKELAKSLKKAEDRILEEKVTNSNVSTQDSKEIIYSDFNAGNSITDKNIYEVIKNHESNHKLNRTSNYLKGIILKKHLKGNARLLVSDDLTSYEEIKKILIKRYGNVNELLANLYNHHSKIGQTPPRTGSAVNWTKINETCKSHLTLLRRADLLLKHAKDNVINEKYVTDLIKFLCQEDRYKVLSIKDNPEEAYKMLKEKFTKTLDMSQEMLRLHPKTSVQHKRRNEENPNGSSEFGLITNYELTVAKDCTICQKLQEQGHLQGFFENHLQNRNSGAFYNAQCPLYLKMTMKERLDFLKSNQMCVYCVNTLNATHKVEICRQKNLNTKNGRQPPFTCRTQGCPNRLELCIIHKETNMSALLRRQENLNKNNIEMSLITWTEEDTNEGLSTNCSIDNEYKMKRVNDWLNDAITHNIEASTSHTQHSENSLAITENGIAQDADRPLLVEHKESLLKRQDVLTLNEQSRAIFMYTKIKGYTRGISVMFDSGSSAVICSDCIPGKELKACKLQDQAIDLQGLGATKRRAQAWTILLPILQNKFVATTAYSVPHILGPLSPVNLAPAHELIKKSAKDNEEVQRSKIYNYLSGNIELLIGIRLNCLFPEKVFQMTNGLSLYRLKLASHDHQKTFCLGGPFEIIAEMKEIFQESANFLNEIDAGLVQWRSGNTAKMARIYCNQSEQEKEEYAGIISENSEITDSDLNEIDEFLDASSCSNGLQEVINIIPAGTDSTKKESIVTLTKDDSEPPNQSKDSNAHLIIELNNPYLIEFIKSTQEKILLQNTIPQNLQYNKKFYIEIANIHIKDWKIGLNELRAACKTTNTHSGKLQFTKRFNPDDNTLSLAPKPETTEYLTYLQQDIYDCLKAIDNMSITLSDKLEITIIKARPQTQVMNIPDSKQEPPEQLLKELKIFSHTPKKNPNNRRLLARIKLRKKVTPTQEFSHVTEEHLINTNKDHSLTQQSDFKAKDSLLIKNLELIIDGPKVGYRCNTCSNCNRCKQNPNQAVMTMKEQLEQYLIEKSVFIDRTNKQFIAKLPLTHDPSETLLPNKNETKVRLRKVLQRLRKSEEDSLKIKAVFDKLKELKYIVKLTELPNDTQEKIKAQTINYFIPWDYVSKPTSITTEKRQVYDASAKTQSGNSLNDILSKGCPKMEFDSVLLNFVSNKFALCGDIMKFYQSVKLHEDHYHLQLILWNETMDPDEEPTEYVITRLTFGLKSSSQQLEHCVDLLAEENKHKGDLYRILKYQRYVDDILGSYDTMEKVNNLKTDLDDTLENYGMKIKGYACSYEKPPDTISDGISITTGGYVWQPELDIIFIRVQPLHYAEKKRGKIMTENIFMEGTIEELDSFVPQSLTLRQVLSRGAQIYDPLGLVNPWKTGVKILTRESLESVKKDWDAPLSLELRERWIKKFWDMQELKTIGFKRCSLPIDFDVKGVSLICFCDAGKHAKVQIVYLIHENEKSICNIQMLYSKSQLVQANKTLANMELDSMNHGAELLYKCYNALPKVDRVCLVGDSQITSYWIARDTISLATFQRNRVSNIRRLININDIYRCKGTENVADIGTKGEINIADSIPGSRFHTGPKWLKHGIKNAIALGHLIAIKETHIDPNNTTLWKMATDGLVGKCKWPNELLMKKYDEDEHPIMAINHQWVSQVKERYAYSEYLVDPLRKSWDQTIRTLSVVLYFLHKILKRKLEKGSKEQNDIRTKRWKSMYGKIFDVTKESEQINFCQTFTAMVTEKFENHQTSQQNEPIHSCEQIKRSPNSLYQSICSLITKLGNDYPARHILDLFQDGITANFFQSLAILYFLKKASKELEVFYKKGMIKKHCYKAGNLYFSKNRWIETNQLRVIDDDNINLQELHIQELAPVLDRHSPVAISIALYFHNKVTKHAGADRSHLAVQGSVFIFQGQKLFEDICRDCITCRIKLKQRYNQIMGPLGKEQLSFSAVGRFLFLDMSGPYDTKIAINSRTTRRNSNVTKTWLLHGVCVVSSYSVVQVLETYATDSFVQAVHRIACYIGFPQIALIDSSQTEIKGLTKSSFSMYNASNELFDEYGITIKLCGVGPESHSRHGVIERRIALFKKYFEISKQKIADLTPIGLYTLALQAAAHLNAAPLCTKRRNGSTISSRLITPNCFFMGKRNSHRSPADIPYIEEDRSVMIDKLYKATEGMLSFFKVNIPDLLLRSCNTQESRDKINKGDLILFMKDESAIAYNWKMGIVYDLENDDDGNPRILQITYVNKDEISLPLNKNDQKDTSITKRITRKGIHTIVKLHSIDEKGINSDLAYLNKLLHKHQYNCMLPEELVTLVLESNSVDINNT